LKKILYPVVATASIVAVAVLHNVRKSKTVTRRWSPVKTYDATVTEEELKKVRCPIDYPCVFESEGDMSCMLTALLCSHFPVRCDIIIRNRLETCEETFTLFSDTANERYMTYYNPRTGALSITEFKRK